MIVIAQTEICSLFTSNGKNVDEKEFVNIKQTELKLLRVTLDHPPYGVSLQQLWKLISRPVKITMAPNLHKYTHI